MLKVLINAYACSPGLGSEPGMAWNRVSNFAKCFEFHIISKLYANWYKLNDSVVKYMSATFGLKLTPTTSDILACLSDEISLKENDIHKEPLIRLKQDTIKQMHDDGVIY